MEKSKAKLTLEILGYDEEDAFRSYFLISNTIVDFLAACINIEVSFPKNREEFDDQFSSEHSSANAVWAEIDWIDGAPVVGDCIALSKDQLFWLDAYTKGKIDNRHVLARASRHIAEALRLRSLGTFGETSDTLLVSSLEALAESIPNPASCEKCGQPTYKITQRVNDLVDLHLGGHVARQVKDFYNLRSKYLHEGTLRSWHSYTHEFSPQLDPEDPTGCVVPRSPALNINLLEYTSFIFRAHISLWRSMDSNCAPSSDQL